MGYLIIRELLEDTEAGLELKLLAGEAGLNHRLTVPKVQKMGLVLAGIHARLHPEQMQILGQAEISYLRTLPEEEIASIVRQICSQGVAGFIVTGGLTPPPLLVAESRRRGIPLLVSSLATPALIERLLKLLEEKSSPKVYLHGVLLDVLGLGVLIMGKSGIGKSECALDLISRGYRLIADDVVMIHKRHPDLIYGSSTGLIKHHMEIRGLGIINIKDLFGITAVRDMKHIQLVVELVTWDEENLEPRLPQTEAQQYHILGVDIPHLKMPVSPGRNLAVIIEVAARNQLLKMMGHDSADRFLRTHGEKLRLESEKRKQAP